MIAGYPILVGLTCTSAFAALTITRRYEPESRSEGVVFAGVAWAALIALPIYALGYAGWLTASKLAITSLLLHLAVIGVVTPRASFRRSLHQTVRYAGQLIAAPFAVVLDALRARSMAFLGLLAAAVTLIYAVVLTWYVPSFRHWDCLWYHEPIVASTIQNHGFARTYVPDTLMRMHGYPRMGEMLMLWFVVFTDRRLLELTSVLSLGLYFVAIYTIARRFGGTRSVSAGWAVGFLCVPAVMGELQSAMIDLPLGAFVASMLALMTRRTFRARDAIAVTVAGFLIIHTKYLGVVSALSCAGVAAVRLIAAHRSVGRSRVLGALLLGTLLLGAAIGMTLGRNYVEFHSPFWPHQLEIKALHYKSAGWPERGPGGQEGLAEPWSVVVDYLYGSPAGWAHGDVRDGISNYGLSPPWVLLPCALFALPLGLWQIAIRLGGTGARRASAAWDALRLLGVPLVCEVLSSPATWAARYHFGTLAMLVGFAVATTATRAALGEAAAGAFLLLGAMTRYWSPDILMPREKLTKLMRVPYPRREVADALGAPIVEATGLARERELGSGALVVTSDNYGNYPALLWNNDYSNRVVFLPWTAHFLEDATALDPTWIFLADSDPNRARALAAGWQEVGSVSVSRWGRVYRRP